MSWSKALRTAVVRDRQRRAVGAPGVRNVSNAMFAAIAAFVVAVTGVYAQTPLPVVRVSFAEAIQRAQERNPTVAAAAASILRAEGLVQQARAATLFQLNANVVSTTLNRSVEFDGATVTPRSQLTATLTADMPIVAAAAWARRAQAEDTRTVAELSVADVKREIAFAAADAYLTILAARRVVESNVIARDTAKAHFDLATQLEQRGTGSRLNALRAEQQYSADSGLVEVAQLAVYRAQEALGALIVADGPADATDEPDFATQSLPAVAAFSTTNLMRTDLQLLAAQRDASERIVRDTTKEWYPTVDALFQPSSTYPAQFFIPQNSWRFLVQANIPIFDSGLRSAERIQRRADVEQFSATLSRAVIDANAQVRAAREAIASGERSLAAARASADQALQVVNITNISFRAGAATNIEVIDAERVSRDSSTAVAIAEDRLRRARLELLNALGRFP
jgi:outer membrane protein TolC